MQPKVTLTTTSRKTSLWWTGSLRPFADASTSDTKDDRLQSSNNVTLYVCAIGTTLSHWVGLLIAVQCPLSVWLHCVHLHHVYCTVGVSASSSSSRTPSPQMDLLHSKCHPHQFTGHTCCKPLDTVGSTIF